MINAKATGVIVLTSDGLTSVSYPNATITNLQMRNQTNVPIIDAENVINVKKGAIKILPLGDSITFGCGDICTVGDPCQGGYGENYKCCAKPFGDPPHPWTPCFTCSGSYRVPLLEMLQNDSSTNRTAWQYVGTTEMDDGLKHEGHPGWRIDQLSAARTNWTLFQPDIILLMAGTNDIGQLYNISCDKTLKPWICNTTDIISRLDILLKQTFYALPNTHVFVSDLIGIGQNPCYGPDPTADGDQMVLAYNAQLSALTKKYHTKGNKCTYIPLLTDTEIGQDGKNLCPCHYHPTHHGYGLIAQEYFKYMKSYINS